jgi:energy-coupling factor transport system ATP-binding protein
VNGIKFENVDFSYSNEKEVLHGITLMIRPGENIAIIGQNGAGKTTLVKMMNGILKPANGFVSVNGLNTLEHSTATISRLVAYVYQNPDDQIFNNSIRKELSFAASYHNMKSSDIERNLNEAAELCGISDILEENPYNIPLSVRKFVSIASVIVLEPEYLILDEPTAGQDKWGLEMINGIIQYMLQRKKTIITITHDMDFAAMNFSRIIAMSGGQVQYDGSTDRLFWNDPVLKRCRLTPPVITRLGRIIGIPKPVISVEEFVKYYS